MAVGDYLGFGAINSFLNPEKGYKDAAKEAERAWAESQGYLRPYWQQGQDQYGRLNTAENALLNPGDLYNQWASQFQMSPYGQQLLEENKAQGLDAASSMGLSGSSAALSNIQKSAGNIMNSERQQYMNDLMQKYMTGIGLGQNIYGTGANAGGQLMQGRMNLGGYLGDTAYGSANAPGERWGRLAGMAGSMLNRGGI